MTTTFATRVSSGPTTKRQEPAQSGSRPKKYYSVKSIKARSTAILDLLVPVMTSNLPDVREALRNATIQYVETFSTINPTVDWVERHRRASMKALTGLKGKERSYAATQIDRAFRNSRRRPKAS